ncbi:unnamed protein product [Protopolystoma xenopodis]|uniref:Uncharacterized protein n=1 Tax=Protopolystoma xenopodis TaxID=117903 RepID=A0A3S5BW34_9PLAT|nr:unnamed protein product [Protopolystoma xenopodis]
MDEPIRQRRFSSQPAHHQSTFPAVVVLPVLIGPRNHSFGNSSQVGILILAWAADPFLAGRKSPPTLCSHFCLSVCPLSEKASSRFISRFS